MTTLRVAAIPRGKKYRIQRLTDDAGAILTWAAAILLVFDLGAGLHYAAAFDAIALVMLAITFDFDKARKRHQTERRTIRLRELAEEQGVEVPENVHLIPKPGEMEKVRREVLRE